MHCVLITSLVSYATVKGQRATSRVWLSHFQALLLVTDHLHL